LDNLKVEDIGEIISVGGFKRRRTARAAAVAALDRGPGS
jgi:hypothetical protein